MWCVFIGIVPVKTFRDEQDAVAYAADRCHYDRPCFVARINAN